MKYYSTNDKNIRTSLQQAVVKGLAPDKGLFMPERINKLPDSFFNNIKEMGLHDIAKVVANSFLGDDIEDGELNRITEETLNFEIPIVEVDKNIFALELFHGPTFAFKDVGARFMARMLSHFADKKQQGTVNVLVATSGDTGSAVANGFLGVKDINVFVLYPSGKVSDIQEAQFTTLGQNIIAIEVDGTFDDCQSLVKSAFADQELNEAISLTSANSINVARFLPQSFYYFHAYAQLLKKNISDEIIISVPSGNFGNLTAGLFAQHMGLPIKRFIAANNENDIFYEYLKTGKYTPRRSVLTIANAMDVGDPSNFARILDLYNHSHKEISEHIEAYRYSDDEIKGCIRDILNDKGYLLDPHGACAYMGAKASIKEGETALFLATAHPAKFKNIVEECIDRSIEIPDRLAEFTKGQKQTIKIKANYNSFRETLIKAIAEE